MGDAPTVAAVSQKLLELDKEDVNGVRSFLPGKILGRTAALLALGVLCLSDCARQARSSSARQTLLNLGLIKPPASSPGACRSIRGFVSLAKAPTDSMTPTTKLAHPFHCLLEGGER
jgi:hypothetical protein